LKMVNAMPTAVNVAPLRTQLRYAFSCV
jgi:hypothetical protein